MSFLRGEDSLIDSWEEITEQEPPVTGTISELRISENYVCAGCVSSRVTAMLRSVAPSTHACLQPRFPRVKLKEEHKDAGSGPEDSTRSRLNQNRLDCKPLLPNLSL